MEVVVAFKLKNGMALCFRIKRFYGIFTFIPHIRRRTWWERDYFEMFEHDMITAAGSMVEWRQNKLKQIIESSETYKPLLGMSIE